MGIYFSALFLITTMGACIIYMYNVEKLSENMDLSIKTYSDIYNGKYDVDRQYLCKTVGCSGIINVDTDKIFKINKGILRLQKRVSNEYMSIHHLWEDIYILNKRLVIFNNLSNTFYLTPWDNFFNLLLIVSIIDFISVILLIIPAMRLFKQQKIHELIEHMGNSNILLDKNTVEITENIQHEISSPLEVIYNHVEMVKRDITKHFGKFRPGVKNGDVKLYKQRLKKEEKILKWFEIIEIAEKQIFEKIQEMSDFKHLKYRKDKKRNIYKLVKSAASLIASKTLYVNVQIDERLKQFTAVNVPESDLIGIFLNHIKNSIEEGADADTVKFEIKSINKNEMLLYIIDNGNGIDKSFIKYLFVENLSTKDDDGVLRGNGMFLSKIILERHKGSISLVTTGIKGTILGLKFKVEQLEKKD